MGIFSNPETWVAIAFIIFVVLAGKPIVRMLGKSLDDRAARIKAELDEAKALRDEAQRLLVRYLFAHTQVNRVQALTEATNTAEQWALQKAGFTREGVLRGYGFRDGAWRDAVIYSVLRHEVTEHEHDASGSVTEKPKASTTRVPRRGARDRTA